MPAPRRGRRAALHQPAPAGPCTRPRQSRPPVREKHPAAGFSKGQQKTPHANTPAGPGKTPGGGLLATSQHARRRCREVHPAAGFSQVMQPPGRAPRRALASLNRSDRPLRSPGRFSGCSGGRSLRKTPDCPLDANPGADRLLAPRRLRKTPPTLHGSLRALSPLSLLSPRRPDCGGGWPRRRRLGSCGAPTASALHDRRPGASGGGLEVHQRDPAGGALVGRLRRRQTVAASLIRSSRFSNKKKEKNPRKKN